MNINPSTEFDNEPGVENAEPGTLHRCVIAFGGAWLCALLIVIGAWAYVWKGRKGFEAFLERYVLVHVRNEFGWIK